MSNERETELERLHRARVHRALMDVARTERAPEALRSSVLAIAAAETTRASAAATGKTLPLWKIGGALSSAGLAAMVVAIASGSPLQAMPEDRSASVHAAPAIPAPAPPSMASEPVSPIASVPIDELPTVPSSKPRMARPSNAGTREAPAPAPAPSPPSAASRLAAETRALTAIRAASRDGDANEALRLIDDYGRSFPSGVLAEEAEFFRIESLGRAGRRPEAVQRAHRFFAERPSSPYAARLRAMGFVPQTKQNEEE